MTKNNYDQYKTTLVYLPPKIVQQPPLGIATVAGHLKACGYQVDQLDLNLELHLEEKFNSLFDESQRKNWEFSPLYRLMIKPKLNQFLDKWAKTLSSSNSRIIGFSAFHHNVPVILDLSTRVKKLSPEKIIVIGGPQTTYDSKSLQHESIDFLIIGDGEVILENLLNALINNQHPNTVEGISYKSNNQWTNTSSRKNTLDLNKIAPPEFKDFKLDQYPELFIPLETSRGCVYRCTFCSETVMFSPFRFKKAEFTYKEIKTLQKDIGTHSNFFYFTDSLINGHIKELDRLCDIMIKNNDYIHWGGKASIRDKMTREFLQKLYDAGCRLLDFGIESAAPNVLKDMKKSFTRDVASRVIKDCYEIGIQVHLMWIVGFPTETEDDHNISLDFVKENHPYIHAISPGYGCTVHDPRADLMQNPEKYGIYWKWGGIFKSPHSWYSKVTTPSIRKRRVKEFHKLCHDLKMKVW
ncbi:MAG: cobalamin-dependent protein [Bacteriovoracaceae bacterium]|nr:cobalamin-dependent protein [Bacteriovoracaceae bacterium]